MLANFDFISAQKKHAGKWVAFSRAKRKVVASGIKAKIALEKAQKAGVKKPILFRMPKRVMPFVGSNF